MMLLRASFDHLISAYFSREQPHTNGTDQRDDQPRSPERWLQQYDVKKPFIVNRIADRSANGSGLSLKKSEQSTPNVNYHHPQTHQISCPCQKKIIDDRAKRTRHEEQSE